MKTSKPLLTLRMLFPAAASFIVLLLGEWIARGSLTADTFISFIFPHFGAYLLAWLLLFLVWERQMCIRDRCYASRRLLRWAWPFWAVRPAQ